MTFPSAMHTSTLFPPKRHPGITPSQSSNISLVFLSPALTLREVEPITRHTTPVLPHQIPTRLLRVGGGGEEHALVARGFLVFADATGL